MRRPGHSTAEAARLTAETLGLKGVTGLHAYRTAVKAKLIDHVSARGRSAPRVTSTETSILCLSLMSMSDAATNASNVPNIVRRVTRLSAGADPQICLMGDDQTPVASGSFVDALTQAIEGKVDPLKGHAQAFGLQFCKGEVRAWAEWERINGRVYFGVRELPRDDVIQEVRIGTRVIDTLRQIAGTSTEMEVPEMTTPTQRQTELAAVISSSHFSPENHCDWRRGAPLVYASHGHEDNRVEVKNQPNSGAHLPPQTIVAREEVLPMSTIRATDALRLLNTEYGCNLSYQKFNRDIVAGLIPAERSDDGRSWAIAEGDLDRIAARFSAARPRRTRSAA